MFIVIFFNSLDGLSKDFISGLEKVKYCTFYIDNKVFLNFLAIWKLLQNCKLFFLFELKSVYGSWVIWF